MTKILDAQRLAFARDLADPDFSLSVPELAKAIIRDLLAEREYVRMVLNDPKYGHDIEWVRLNVRGMWTPGAQPSPVRGVLQRSATTGLYTEPSEREPT